MNLAVHFLIILKYSSPCPLPFRRILKKDPPFPKEMGLAKDLIQRLLIKDPKKRLGSGPNGAENVKKHPFYQVGHISRNISHCLKYTCRVGCGLRCIMEPLGRHIV